MTSRRQELHRCSSGRLPFEYGELIGLLRQRSWPSFREGPGKVRTFCPLCEGDTSNSPSLSITRGRTGLALLFCFSGKNGCGLGLAGDRMGSVREALKAFQSAPVPILAVRRYKTCHAPGKSPTLLGAKEVAQYEYPNGKLKVRYEWPDGWSKDFRWPQGKGGRMLYKPPTPIETAR